jgi:hypothetical protein
MSYNFILKSVVVITFALSTLVLVTGCTAAQSLDMLEYHCDTSGGYTPLAQRACAALKARTVEKLPPR